MDGPLSRGVAVAVVERRGARARSVGLAVLSLIADVEEQVERAKREEVATRRPRWMSRRRGT